MSTCRSSSSCAAKKRRQEAMVVLLILLSIVLWVHKNVTLSYYTDVLFNVVPGYILFRCTRRYSTRIGSAVASPKCLLITGVRYDGDADLDIINIRFSLVKASFSAGSCSVWVFLFPSIPGTYGLCRSS